MRGVRSWELGACIYKLNVLRRTPNSQLLDSSAFLSILREQTDNHPPMKQPESLELVAEFHKTFKHPIQPKPVIPDENRCRLRVALIAEELKELEVAILEKDIVSVADALCDIQYVLSGAILAFGLGEKFKTLFDEVQRSNMSKACNTLEEAQATIDHYKKKDGTECYYREEA